MNSLWEKIRTIGALIATLALVGSVWLVPKTPDDPPGSFDPKDVPASLDRRVPLALDWSNSQKLFDDVPELKDNARIRHLLDVLTANANRMNAYKTAHASCAVVGSSQNMLGKHYGKLIDSHDYVFRMNAAPIVSYEQDVGSKTTHHFFSHQYGHYQKGEGGVNVPFYGPGTFNILYPMPTTVYLRMKPVYQTQDYRDYKGFLLDLAAAADPQADMSHIPEDMQRMRQVPNLIVMMPEFWWYVNTEWFLPKAKKLDDRTSSGFLVVIMAHAMCDRVDVFGFGPDKNGDYGHYFSKNINHLDHHRPGYQEEFMDYLEKTGIITLYR